MDFNLYALMHLFKQLPATIEEAVNQLFNELDPERLSVIRNLPLHKVRRLHYSLGYQIEEALTSRHDPESTIMSSSGALKLYKAPDFMIMELWQRLQDQK